jgi:hypothetical protein
VCANSSSAQITQSSTDEGWAAIVSPQQPIEPLAGERRLEPQRRGVFAPPV